MREEGKFLAGQPFQDRIKEYRRTRWQSAKQQSGHYRLLKISLGILFCCAIIWSWQKLANPQTLPIKSIQITGLYEHVDHAALQQLILPYTEKGFLWADTAALQDRLQQLPWIYNANVKRAWPDKLIINLSEQKPVARMADNKLVNAQGDIFAVDQATIPAGLPTFISPLAEQQKLMLQNYQSMNTILAPLAVKIVALALDARQSWSLQLDNGIVVIVGKVDPLQHLQRFAQVYPQVVGASAAAINSVDLRYASGVAVRFKNAAKS